VLKTLFDVEISASARKAAKKLPEHYRRRTLEALFMLRENPTPAELYDVKKLAGSADTYRIRIGDIRIIYEIKWDVKAVNVLTIHQRENAYS
jgi:mRNA interferase RelE/StbE